MRHNKPVQVGKKTCKKCRRRQVVQEFYPHKTMGDGRLNVCRTCTKATANKWRENPQNRARWNKQRHFARIHEMHGISLEEYEKLYKDARCAGCGLSHNYRVHSGCSLALDHDHTTGKHRGLLCYRCNMALGCVRDDPEVLRRLARYLGKGNAPRQRPGMKKEILCALP